MELRTATLDDIPVILRIEREYYEGFCCPAEVLRAWINGLPQQFLVAEEAGAPAAYLFFEYLDTVCALPFIHPLQHCHTPVAAYVSEIGAAPGAERLLQSLVNRMAAAAAAAGCSRIVWVTGERCLHDRIELQLLRANGFQQRQRIERWEALPGRFVDDHALWEKMLAAPEGRGPLPSPTCP